MSTRVPCSQCGGQFLATPASCGFGFSHCDSHRSLEMIKRLTARTAATDAVIEACRVLRARRMDEAADAVINALERIQAFAEEGS